MPRRERLAQLRGFGIAVPGDAGQLRAHRVEGPGRRPEGALVCAEPEQLLQAGPLPELLRCNERFGRGHGCNCRSRARKRGAQGETRISSTTCRTPLVALAAATTVDLRASELSFPLTTTVPFLATTSMASAL